jgi:hypothetical protein
LLRVSPLRFSSAGRGRVANCNRGNLLSAVQKDHPNNRRAATWALLVGQDLAIVDTLLVLRFFASRSLPVSCARAFDDAGAPVRGRATVSAWRFIGASATADRQAMIAGFANGGEAPAAGHVAAA